MTGEEALCSAEKVLRRCREIATYSELAEGIYRPFLCDSARAVLELVGGWMRAAGMDVEVDAAGNLRGLYAADSEAAPRLLIVSHLDTVPNAGAFDGILGVMAGLSLVEELEGKRLPFAIEVIGFSEEEGVRFGRPFLGSMALTGDLNSELLHRRDRDGVSVEQALVGFGLDPSRLGEAMVTEEAFASLELHIEQGPVLDRADRALGVVDTIVGQTRLAVVFRGTANHAGTTPMSMRSDPVAAAAEWISSVERRATETTRLVATVGRLQAAPGAANVIAAEVAASLDVRHADDEERAKATCCMVDLATGAAGRRGVAVTFETITDQPAVAMSSKLSALLGRAVQMTGSPVEHLSSGAGHDAMVLAGRMPTAMLFVRSPGGVSHHPRETVLVEDVAAALRSMAVLLELLGDEQVRRAIGNA